MNQIKYEKTLYESREICRHSFCAPKSLKAEGAIKYPITQTNPTIGSKINFMYK